jgi:hypothetical protein
VLAAAGAAAAVLATALPQASAREAIAVGGAAGTTGPFGINKTFSKTVLLINGDRLTVTGGRVAVTFAGHGFAAAVTELRVGGHRYLVPDAALAYLGRGLDLSLFDVAALPGGGRLPVRISYAGRAPRLPGVTITHAADGVAAGYLTAASARAFGAALARQLRADHGRASYGSDGLFGGGVSVSLAGAAQLSVPRSGRAPRFPMHTLTVRGVDQAGRPDTGDMLTLVNAVNAGIFGVGDEAQNVFYRGVAKFSVPAGRYFAFGFFFAFDRHGSPVGIRLVFNPRITVSGNTSVTLHALSATSRVAFVTPKPAAVSQASLDFAISQPNAGLGYSFGWSGDVPFWVSPVRWPPAAGSMQEFATAELVPRGQPSRPDTLPDTYFLAFQRPKGVIGAQRYVADKLATVHATFSSDVPTIGSFTLTGVPADELQDGIVEGLQPISVPSRQTEYLSAGAGVFWFGQYVQSAETFSGGQLDSTRVFIPGSQTNIGWNTYPLHTVLNTSLLGGKDPNGALLSATRAGNALTLHVTPFSDSTTGHTGTGFAPGAGHTSGRYRISQDGTTLAAGVAPGRSSFDTQLNLSAKPSTVSFTLNASRTGALYPLSTVSSTTWTWQSASGPVTNLPAGWFCADGRSQACSVQPLLTLDYSVAGIAVDGTAPPGAQVVKLTIGHQPFAAAADITSATASVSFDGGATWQPAAVTGAGGTRFAAFDAPPGSYVSVKVSAADAAGNTVTETLMRAYATATPAAASGAAGAAGRAGAASPAGAAGAGGYRAACPPAGPGEATCFVLYTPRTVAAVARAAGFGTVSAPAGWGARAIERAYRLPVARNPRQTVAVVGAFDTPRLQSYLNTYRRQYGLPPCTTANGCFRKVNGAGRAGPLPRDGTLSGWDLEATLDVDMVSAACPRCRILVVEAKTPLVPDLAAAEDAAVRLGAAVVSNSFGGRENGFALTTARAFRHPGHAIVVASGDKGFNAAAFPADLASVTAVGGTELTRAPNSRGYTETVWNEFPAGAGGSGCSAYVGKPRWQRDRHCPGRTVADVAALAWNVAVYNRDWGGWGELGGTSAAAPIVAGVYGLAGNAAAITPGYEYAHTRSLFDISDGSNDFFLQDGATCGGDYLCVAKKGYDAPTGLGTPDGIGAF